ncbi:MAG: LLM class flavin-dependent oxidoreductase [Ktedonobacteraceae bacterium]|nr:LLM class flavin-dependent oxidoreductase [Ktedonobacteraceae bacterium]
MSTVDFGLMLRHNDSGHSVHELLQYNQACIETLSEAFTTLWLEDHMQVGATDALESLTTLSYLAALYPRLKIGTLVLSQSYRNPALVAKMLANLQILTGGRVILGVGAGWKEDEYRSYGYPFPALKTRMEQLEEAVQIIRALWSSQPATFEGKYYTLRDAYCAPLPSPAIPLLIGGGGEQRTLALVARYADWWNFNSVPVEEYARKVEILKQHCANVGRTFADIKLSYLGTLSVSEDPVRVQRNPGKHYIAGSAAEVTRELESFQAIGVTHFMFRIPDLETLQHFVANVAPHFA